MLCDDCHCTSSVLLKRRLYDNDNENEEIDVDEDDDKNLCESCCLFKPQTTITTTVNSSSSTTTLAETSSQLFCTICKKNEFLIPLSCACKQSISCERCFSQRNPSCPLCKSEINMLYWDIQVYFDRHNTISCRWCGTQGIVIEEFLSEHLHSTDGCVEIIDPSERTSRERQMMIESIKDISQDATQAWLEHSNKEYDGLKSIMCSEEENPFFLFYKKHTSKRSIPSTTLSIPVSASPKRQRIIHQARCLHRSSLPRRF